jgi:hypothetical protein
MDGNKECNGLVKSNDSRLKYKTLKSSFRTKIVNFNQIVNFEIHNLYDRKIFNLIFQTSNNDKKCTF